ncbi:hypothetical protein ACJMK2_008599 [Sinanodonta woodiana]|uniref:Phospholipid scramblase n=1 Tax=Sinanodonta woodiana TaxID=1069815 RepID=A0ABD3VQF8_SINWO
MASVTDQPMTLKPMGGMLLPQGLAYLTQIDQLIIKQKVELLEVLTGCETRNKYEIFNSLNQQIYYAKEESSFCMRYWCGPNRGFVIHITDNDGQEVMTLTREFKCCAGCCWCADACCGFLLRVEAPPGNVVGYCKQRTSCCALHMDLMDAQMQPLFKIWGPCCPCQCLCCPMTSIFHDISTLVIVSILVIVYLHCSSDISTLVIVSILVKVCLHCSSDISTLVTVYLHCSSDISILVIVYLHCPSDISFLVIVCLHCFSDISILVIVYLHCFSDISILVIVYFHCSRDISILVIVYLHCPSDINFLVIVCLHCSRDISILVIIYLHSSSDISILVIVYLHCSSDISTLVQHSGNCILTLF